MTVWSLRLPDLAISFVSPMKRLTLAFVFMASMLGPSSFGTIAVGEQAKSAAEKALKMANQNNAGLRQYIEKQVAKYGAKP